MNEVQPIIPDAAYQTATFSREGDRVFARFGLTLENHLDEVWAALTMTDALVDWLAPGSIDPRPGGAVRLDFVDSGIVIDSRVTQAEHWKRLEYSWSGPGEPERPARFELEPVGAGVVLTLTLSLPEGEDVARSAAGWAAHLDMLAAALAGAPIKFPFEIFRTARETYRTLLQGL